MISAEEFVKAWQSSSSITEVCKKTGLKAQAANSRAGNYRQRGINLKRLARKMPRLDVPALNRLAREAAKGGNGKK